MALVQGTLNQLSFDVVDPADDDEEPVAEPALSTYAISGQLMSRQTQRYLKSRLEVRIVDTRSGEIVAAARARVTDVRFPLHEATDSNPEWTERLHRVKVGEAIERSLHEVH